MTVLQNDVTRNAASAVGFSRMRRRIFIYGLTLLTLSLIQTTVLHLVPILGTIPDLCLLFVLGTAMFDGAENGGAVGIAAGFLENALGGVGISLLPLLFFVVGYGTGLLAGKALARTFPSYMIFALVFCLLRPAITLADIGLSAHTSGFGLNAITEGTLVPEFFANLVAAPPMYLLIRKTNRLIQKKK